LFSSSCPTLAAVYLGCPIGWLMPAESVAKSILAYTDRLLR
jgi:hypothetical protein